ncbi:hypothetical protein GCM10011609_27050 [Lentzea pudingi]|uniref:Uncharacterized protein n=1 Tax=Lentzea pudingi TaxID=1789439 RepID=A0ABQ2HQN8_9PSEU|nr:hypothetical protein GCM10011609_27050 [Lentzea pudingi]
MSTTTPADGSAGQDTARRAADLRQLLAGLTAVRDGDLGIRLPGEIGTVCNGTVDQLSPFTSEVTRGVCEVGSPGGQAEVAGVAQSAMTDQTDTATRMVPVPAHHTRPLKLLSSLDELRERIALHLNAACAHRWMRAR